MLLKRFTARSNSPEESMSRMSWQMRLSDTPAAAASRRRRLQLTRQPPEDRSRVPGRKVDIRNPLGGLSPQPGREEELRFAIRRVEHVLDAQERLDRLVAVAGREIDEGVAVGGPLTVFIGEAIPEIAHPEAGGEPP